eukprot:364015-Chlamydomonas_euryale.AAC.5
MCVPLAHTPSTPLQRTAATAALEHGELLKREQALQAREAKLEASQVWKGTGLWMCGAGVCGAARQQHMRSCCVPAGTLLNLPCAPLCLLAFTVHPGGAGGKSSRGVGQRGVNVHTHTSTPLSQSGWRDARAEEATRETERREAALAADRRRLEAQRADADARARDLVRLFGSHTVIQVVVGMPDPGPAPPPHPGRDIAGTHRSPCTPAAAWPATPHLSPPDNHRSPYTPAAAWPTTPWPHT